MAKRDWMSETKDVEEMFGFVTTDDLRWQRI